MQTQIGGGSVDPNLGLRFVARNKREIQKKKIDTLLVSVVQQIRAYTEISPDRVKEIMSRAARAPATGEMAGTDRLTVQGVLKANDHVTIWVDRQSGIQRRMELGSTAGGEPFKGTWTFSQLTNGPWYSEKRVVDIPGESVQFITTNTNFLG